MATARAAQGDLPAIAIRWLVVVGFFVFVEIAIHLGWINQYLVPFPSQILVALYRVVVEENVLTYFAITLGEVPAASAGLVPIGIPFGVLLARRADLWKA